MDERRGYRSRGIYTLNGKADNEKINYPLMIVRRTLQAMSRGCGGGNVKKDHIDNNVKETALELRHEPPRLSQSPRPWVEPFRQLDLLMQRQTESLVRLRKQWWPGRNVQREQG